MVYPCCMLLPLFDFNKTPFQWKQFEAAEAGDQQRIVSWVLPCSASIDKWYRNGLDYTHSVYFSPGCLLSFSTGHGHTTLCSGCAYVMDVVIDYESLNKGIKRQIEWDPL